MDLGHHGENGLDIEMYIRLPQKYMHVLSFRDCTPKSNSDGEAREDIKNRYPGIQFRLPCTPQGQFFMGAKLFIGTLWMRNEGVLKKILVWTM